MRWSCRIPLVTAALAGLMLAASATFAAAAGDGTPPAGAEDREPLSARELEVLVGPVALYPDDLLAIVLPASTHPLQIVQAARYLDALDDDPSLEPDPDWDESVIALLNYPEVVLKLNADLDWTQSLGRAVLTQQAELLAAVAQFRRKAYAAGNLATDRRQRVEVDDSAIFIRRVDPAVIYVPYYEPGLMLSRHRYRVYHYYSRPCPVYYYPYPAGHYLAARRFWGMTGAFGIAWQSGGLSFHLLEHRSHPFYGHDYAFRHYWYFRPRLMDEHWRSHHWRDRDRFGSRWPDRRFHGARPAVRAGEPATPFTRPSASRILDRLERDRDDAALLRMRRAREAAVLETRARAERSAPGLRERAAPVAPRADTAPRLERRMRYRSHDVDPPGVRATSGSRGPRMRYRPQ